MAKLTPEEIRAAAAEAIEKAKKAENTDLREDLDREMRERGA